MIMDDTNNKLLQQQVLVIVMIKAIQLVKMEIKAIQSVKRERVIMKETWKVQKVRRKSMKYLVLMLADQIIHIHPAIVSVESIHHTFTFHQVLR